MNPPPPALPSARCSLRYAELAYGSSTVSVNKLPCASFNSERTSEVICPAELYALDPTTGMEVPLYTLTTIYRISITRDAWARFRRMLPVGVLDVSHKREGW